MSESEFEQVQKIVRKAVKLKRNDELDRARRELEEGLERYPANNFLRASLADLLYRQRQLNRAEKLARDILAEEPDSGRALMVLGNIAYSKRNYEEAHEHFRAAHRNQDNVYSAQRLIRTLMKLERFEKAQELLETWLEKEPDHEYLQKLAASLYEKLGDDDRAEKFYRQHLEESPDDQFAFKEQIKLKLKDKKPAKAVEELENLLRVKKHSQNPHLQALLGELREEMEDLSGAAEAYRRSLELEPDNHYTRQRLGQCLYKDGRYGDALPHLKEAFRQDPGDYYTRSMLMKIFQSLELYEEGGDYFQEIIRDNPGFENLYGMIKKLNRADEEKKEEAEDE